MRIIRLSSLFETSFQSDWKSELENIEHESTSNHPTSYNWREVFDYDELTSNNQNSSLWNEIHRAWWPPPTSIPPNDLPKQPMSE